MRIQKILFPTDFSAASSVVAPYVESMAGHFEAEVTVAHALGLVPAYSDDLYHFLSDNEIDRLVSHRHEMLRAFAKQRFRRLDDDTSVKCVALEGDPARAITRYAEENGTDLIMLPTHGYGGFRQLLLGSITAKILHDVLIPVWTSAHAESLPPSPDGYKRILCGVDFNGNTVTLMQWAAWFADAHGASLCLAHVIGNPDNGIASEAEAERRSSELGYKAGVLLPLRVGSGKVAPVLRQIASDYGADLVIISRGCITGVLGRLRSNAYAIIREAPCPVISL